ncbi:MAG TPA: hypothetical protein VF615_04010 [Longimicrobiaceae bacterium]|jgi:hypothetical protein
MSPLAWAVAVGVLAGLGAALLLVRSGLFPAGPRPPEDGPGDADVVRARLAPDDLRAIRDDIQGLHVVRADLKRVGDLLDRLLEETVESRRRLEPPRPETGGPARDAPRERGWDAAPAGGYPWEQGGWGRGGEARRDDRAAGFDPDPQPRVPAAGDADWTVPAAARPRGPSPDALPVEASNDAVVASERHPPEAWLERVAGEGEVWLNPGVALSDAALQRWSTFFDWEGRDPGARYQATRPAAVTWSGGAGTMLRKGTARPV